MRSCHLPGMYRHLPEAPPYSAFTIGYFMGTQEVVISDPQRNAVDGAIVILITTGDAVGFFKGAVQAFNDLFEWTKFFRDFIVVGKSDDLYDEYVPVLFNLVLLGGQRIGAVSVSYEF